MPTLGFLKRIYTNHMSEGVQKSPRITTDKVTQTADAAQKTNKTKNWNNFGVQAVTYP